MSTTCRLARPPPAPISPATFSAAVVSRSKMPTAQPSSARRRAIAAPMPFAPPVTTTVRSFSPRMSAPKSRGVRRALIGRAAPQHAGGVVGYHHLAVLVLDVDPGDDDAAIALRGGTHGCHLDLAVDGVAHPHRRQDLLLQLEHGKPGALDHALAQEALDQA